LTVDRAQRLPDEGELTRQRRSADLVQAAIGLFDGQAPAPLGGSRWQVGTAQARFTLEAAEALAQLIPAGVLTWLTRNGGWRAVEVAAPGAPRPRRGVRLLSPEVWDGGLSLAFGEAAMDAVVLAAHRRFRLPSGDMRKPPGDWTNGDLLAHHICWQALRVAPGLSAEQDDQRYWLDNPLTRVCLQTGRPAGERDLERLMAPDLAPLLPWLRFHLVACWSARLVDRAGESVPRRAVAVARLLELWLAAVERLERPDMALPLLDMMEPVERWTDSVARMDRGDRRVRHPLQGEAPLLTFEQRQQARGAVARLVRSLTPLEALHRRVLSLHPVEREAQDLLLLRAWDRAGANERMTALRALQDRLEGVVR